MFSLFMLFFSLAPSFFSLPWVLLDDLLSLRVSGQHFSYPLQRNSLEYSLAPSIFQ
jgi:hypothetical protein